MNPSKAYCEAARVAVIEVARREGVEPDTKLYDFFLAQGEGRKGGTTLQDD